MSAAVALRNVVCETENVLVIAVIPPQSQFDRYTITFFREGNGLFNQRRLCPVQELNKGLQTTIIKKLNGFGLGIAGIGQRDAHAGIEEGELAKSVLQCRVIIFGRCENFR